MEWHDIAYKITSCRSTLFISSSHPQLIPQPPSVNNKLSLVIKLPQTTAQVAHRPVKRIGVHAWFVAAPPNRFGTAFACADAANVAMEMQQQAKLRRREVNPLSVEEECQSLIIIPQPARGTLCGVGIEEAQQWCGCP